MTPQDKQFIEYQLTQVTQDIKHLIELCSGRQKFTPNDKELVSHEYASLKSSLRGLAIHVFQSEDGRDFCRTSGLSIAAELTAKGGDSPMNIATCLSNALREISYRRDRLSKYPVVD